MQSLRPLTLTLVLLFAIHFSLLGAETRTFQLTSRYLNIPISQKQPRHKLTFTTDMGETLTIDVRLAQGKADYWVWRDLSALKGKTLTLTYDQDSVGGFQQIYLDDHKKEEATFYQEANRPLFHFTTQRGWHNDPNGLLYYQGEYHLFYQYNPYERAWGNMHWGHAVSTDLVHWRELPLVMEPDHLGMIYSGSAVVDYDNTSGFGSKDHPAIVAIYTANSPEREVQCLAYSLDRGRTFTKYAGNPILDSTPRWNSHSLRDPKVFWYAPRHCWVMVLYEKDGTSIYNSPNLKQWTYQSHIVGFYECPDLIPLPLDGNARHTKWVLMGASETYMVGQFDGKKFTPETTKLLYTSGQTYAAQTIGNLQERVVQIGWGKITHPHMPFRSQMNLPTELRLITTPDGPRLTSMPVAEAETLLTPLAQWSNLTGSQANQQLKAYTHEPALHLKGILQPESIGKSVSLLLDGQPIITYDWNRNLLGGQHYSPQHLDSLQLPFELYIDKTSVEAYIDGGRRSYTLQRTPVETSGIQFEGGAMQVRGLQVSRIQTIWP